MVHSVWLSEALCGLWSVVVLFGLIAFSLWIFSGTVLFVNISEVIVCEDFRNDPQKLYLLQLVKMAKVG